METLNMSGLSKSYPVFSCPSKFMYSHDHCRQSSDISWGRPGEGKVEQQWGRKDRRGDRQVQERQVQERAEPQVQDLRVQLQGGQRTVVDQVEGSEGPVPDLRSKLSQRRGEGNKDLREDLNSRRAGGGGEEGDERPLSPRDQQRRAAAEERERLRNRARGGGGGGGGQQRGGSGGQQRGGKAGSNQHQQQQGRGGQHHGGKQNGREQEAGSRVQVNNQQNGIHEPHQQYGKQGGGKQIPRPKKNTENFNPSHEAPPMR